MTLCSFDNREAETQLRDELTGHVIYVCSDCFLRYSKLKGFWEVVRDEATTDAGSE
jgi:hypothetical protein